MSHENDVMHAWEESDALSRQRAQAVFIRPVRPEEPRDWNKAFGLILFVLFVAALLVAVAAGSFTYGAVASTQAQLADQRLASSLLVNSVRAYDGADAVSVGQGPEGPSLELRESLESGGYVTRIYGFDGYVLEEYALDDTDYDPRQATRLVRSERFDVTVDDGLVTFVTDQGQAQTMLRNSRAVAADGQEAGR